jgi:hypothetical protein
LKTIKRALIGSLKSSTLRHAADDQTDRRFVRHHGDVLAHMVQHHFTDHGQRACHDAQPRFAIKRRVDERIFLPRRVLFGELRLHFAALQRLPATVIDLAQAVAQDRREFLRTRDDRRRFDRALHRAAVNRRDVIVRQAHGQRLGLTAAFIGQIDIGRSGKAIFGAQNRCAVANQIDTRRHRLTSLDGIKCCHYSKFTFDDLTAANLGISQPALVNC